MMSNVCLGTRRAQLRCARWERCETCRVQMSMKISLMQM